MIKVALRVEKWLSLMVQRKGMRVGGDGDGDAQECINPLNHQMHTILLFWGATSLLVFIPYIFN
jgi:hypothetical protein